MRGIESCDYDLSEDIKDWIHQDYYLMAMYALVCGDEPGLFRYLLEAYQSGHMPVGWQRDINGDEHMLIIDPCLLANDPCWGLSL